MGRTAQGKLGVTRPTSCQPCCPRYIADIAAELRSPKAMHDGWQARLLYKKRMFRETDEAVSEPMFIHLSYIQVRTRGHARASCGGVWGAVLQLTEGHACSARTLCMRSAPRAAGPARLPGRQLPGGAR